MTFWHGHAVVITWTLLLLYADAVVVADISGFTAAGWLAVVGLHAALGVPQGAARGRAVGNGAVTVVEDFVLSAVSCVKYNGNVMYCSGEETGIGFDSSINIWHLITTARFKTVY